MPKPFSVWITTNFEKFSKRWGYQTTISASWEVCMQVRKQQLELDMELQTGSKLGKENVKVVYCHPVYLTYMQSTSCEMLDWINHKLESRLPVEIPTWYADNTTLIAESEGELKSLLMKVREEIEKADLKLKFKKQTNKNKNKQTKNQTLWHPVLSLHDKLMGKKWKQWQILFSWALKSLWMVTSVMKLKDLAPWKKSYDKARQCIKKWKRYWQRSI